MPNDSFPVTGAQRSVQWLLDRCGRCTASRLRDVMAKLASGKPAKARDDYLFEVVIERLTGNPTEHFANVAMSWGVEQEAFARMAYEAHTGAIVEEVGFILHPDIPEFGCSPDGLIGGDGGLEIKAPYQSANHLRTILEGMPPDHMPQVQGSIFITGRQYWDFVSFDPRMPEPLQLYIQRIPRDEDYIKSLADDVAKFLADADALLARLKPQESAPQEVPVSVSAGPEAESISPSESGVNPPAAADPEYITADQALTLETMLQDAGIELAAFKKKAGVERLSQIHAARFNKAVQWVNARMKEKAA